MPSSVARLRSALATSVVRRSWAIALHLVEAHVEAGHPMDGAALRMVMLSCSKSVQWARTLKILEEPQLMYLVIGEIFSAYRAYMVFLNHVTDVSP